MKQEILFPNGNRAQLVIAPAGGSASTILQLLDFPRPKAVIMIVGGAAKLDEQLHPDLTRLFTQGIAHLAASLDAVIIDGGTQSGVMAFMGQGVAAQQKKVSLIGVSLSDHVTYPGKPDSTSVEGVPLEPNHTHFVLVEAVDWGDVTKTMYELARTMSAHCPSVAVLVNGGLIAKNEVLYNVSQKRTIVVIEGSGRLANDLASIRQEHSTSLPDPSLAEIALHGKLEVFPYNGNVTEFKQLIRRLLLG